MASSEKESGTDSGFQLPQRRKMEQAESRMAMTHGYVMLSIGIGGLVAAAGLLPINLLSLSIQNTPKQPVTEFEFHIVAIAILCGLAISACFFEAYQSFERARKLQNQVRRWMDLQDVPADLSHEEYLSLIENGPPKTSASKPWQKRLFPKLFSRHADQESRPN